ncbi:MAG: DNA recombination protein RmuC, partial [Nocardioides sp.]
AHRAERATREQSEQASTRVLETLAPVLEHMRQMQDTVTKVEQSRVSQHAQLAEQIRVTRASVEESRRAATDLAAVLRNNNSVRGAWGETQLRRLVETAGLINRVDFSLQLSVASDSGARRPDMVINLPGGKQMAVDSKVPYNAFMDAQRADLEDTARQHLLTAHAKAVRAHVDALGQKAYWTGLTTSPEFVVAFIPNDQLLNAALEIDPALMEHAFERGVVLATPTTLWGLLKTVAFTWKQESLAQDVQAVFEQGQVVYRRVVTMVDHVEKLGRSIGATVNNYNKFAGSLEHSLLPAARKLGQADPQTCVAPPTEIEESPRMLTAGDFDRDAS